MDVGRGVVRAQGCVSSMRPRVAELFLRGHRAKRPHGGGPQVEVAVTAGDDELGVAGARRRVLQDGVLGRCPVRLVQQRVVVVGGGSGKPERVFGMLSAHAQAVLKPLQGHLVDCLRRAAFALGAQGCSVLQARPECRYAPEAGGCAASATLLGGALGGLPTYGRRGAPPKGAGIVVH